MTIDSETLSAAIEKTLQSDPETSSTLFTEQELQILKLRWGVPDGTRKTLVDIGQKVGLTREEVRQIEYTAVNKYKKWFLRQNQ